MEPTTYCRTEKGGWSIKQTDVGAALGSLGHLKLTELGKEREVT